VAPFHQYWRYFGAMATIQVKNVPDDVHMTLRHRAIDARQSLQEYVLDLLVREARQPTMEEVLARAAARDGGSSVTIEEITAAIREDRDSH
jgi:antitoxin FitA